MGHLGKWMRAAIVLGVLLVYFVFVWRGLTEESRRSLILSKTSASTGDYVIVNVKVTAVDEAQGLLHERLRLIPVGRFAVDRATPAVDLKLLINSVSGKQTVVYPKGERIAPVDFTSILSGNLNRYPFDKYVSDIDVLVTAPVPRAPPAPRASRAPVAPKAAPVPEGVPKEAPEEAVVDPLVTTLVVGASDLNESETVPINENFVASITGVKFEGQVTQDDAYKLMRTSLVMRRANNILWVSVVVMVVMFILAVSVMVMGLRVAGSPTEINLLPLSLCVSLIFGLPALRNVQPGVPAVGALCDYLSFIWAEFIVATSAIGLAWAWIVRSIRRSKET
jgi:Domain of unknown function (DUF4436)